MVSSIQALLVSAFYIALNVQAHENKRQHGSSISSGRIRRVSAHSATSSNQTSFSNTTSVSFACNFTLSYLSQAINSNCTAYAKALEASDNLPAAWERQESVDRFSNCTYHQIFTRFNQAPDGMVKFVMHNGQISLESSLNGNDAAQYGPLVPLEIPFGSGERSVDFLPILEKALPIFFNDLAKEVLCTPSASPSSVTTYGNTTSMNSSAVTQEAHAPRPSPGMASAKLYQAINIAAQQYTRCIHQKKEDIADCTVETTQKLHWLPDSFFVFTDASYCDIKLWTFVSVGVSIVLDAIWLGAVLWFKGSGAFSWLAFLVKVAKGMGQPLIETAVLGRGTSSAWVIAAMKFLQPTPDPLIAVFVGIYLSKGQAFQILATDAVTTIVGLVLMMGATNNELVYLAQSAFTSMYNLPAGVNLIPIGLGLAVLPWLLVYLLIGAFGIPFQLFFLLGIIEAWLLETGYCFAIAGVCLGLMVMEVTFVALTPIFALWELGWVTRNRMRRRKMVKNSVDGEKDEKPVFPLARYLRRRVGESRWKRWLLKFTLWLFVMLCWASFVGKWMFMVNVLNLAGDAFCPSGSSQSALAGLGLRAGIIAIGLVLQFTGLTI